MLIQVCFRGKSRFKWRIEPRSNISRTPAAPEVSHPLDRALGKLVSREPLDRRAIKKCFSCIVGMIDVIAHATLNSVLKLPYKNMIGIGAVNIYELLLLLIQVQINYQILANRLKQNVHAICI
jgi:hypothetical protein